MIDERAMIHSSVKLGKNVSVGPGTVIGADVEIGDDTWIGPHVVIEGPSTIGKNNKIFQFSSVGDEPQDITYKGEPTRLEIGDNNIIREYVMLSRGTVKGGGVTRIGNNNFFMAYTHVGHDCKIGNHIIMVNYAVLAGHVTVNDYATIGASAAVHQFCNIGSYSFLARAAFVGKDVLPFLMIDGAMSSPCGINTVGLRRRGFSSSSIDALRRAYKIIFRKGLTVKQAIAELELMQGEFPEVIPMIDGLNLSVRGIMR